MRGEKVPSSGKERSQPGTGNWGPWVVHSLCEPVQRTRGRGSADQTPNPAWWGEGTFPHEVSYKLARRLG